MNEAQIVRFFKVLSREFPEPARITLTGAAAGSLMGGARPGLDIDFALATPRRDRRAWERAREAARRATQLTTIPADFAAEVRLWGNVVASDAEEHTRPYRRFGALTVRTLDPVYWSVGKVARYLGSDEQELVRVFKRQRVDAEAVARVWGRALRRSPRGRAAYLFRKQAEYFFRRRGPKVWGKKFDPEKTIKRFNKHMGGMK